MVLLNIDLRYAMIATEGMVARRHAELAVRRLIGTAADIKALVVSEYGNIVLDEDERNIAFQEINFLEEELPRLEMYGVVFVLFAVFESVVKRLSESAWLPQVQPEDALKHERRDFVEKANRFYRKHLNVELFADGKEREFFSMLSDVRSAVAHATGEFALLTPRAQRRLRTQWIRKYRGLTVSDGHIVISSELALEAASAVETCLDALIARLKSAYPQR